MWSLRSHGGEAGSFRYAVHKSCVVTLTALSRICRKAYVRRMTNATLKFMSVIALWLAGLGAGAQFAKIAIPFSELREFYPDAGSALGWMLSATSLIGAFLGIVIGGVVGRIGERKTLIGGLLIGAVVSFFQSYLPDFEAMIASRLIEGVSHLAIAVAAPTLIAQITPARMLGVSMALWSTYFGVTFAFVAWLGLPVIAQGQLDVLFAYHGWYMVIMAVIVFVLLYSVQRNRIEAKPVIESIVSLHLRTYSSPAVAAPGVGWLFYTLSFVSLLALLPDLLQSDSAQWIGGLLPLLAIAVSMLMVPTLNRSFAGFKIVMLGFFLSFLFLLVHLAFDLGVLLPILLFSAFGLVQGGSFTAVPELNGNSHDQALSYGFVAQTGNVGNLLGTPILLFALNQSGVTATYLVVAILCAAAVVFHFLLWKAREAKPNLR